MWVWTRMHGVARVHAGGRGAAAVAPPAAAMQ